MFVFYVIFRHINVDNECSSSSLVKTKACFVVYSRYPQGQGSLKIISQFTKIQGKGSYWVLYIVRG